MMAIFAANVNARISTHIERWSR